MEMKLRILHLEDNADDAGLVRLSLARGGLDCDILTVNNGDAFLEALQRPQFDVILSDSGVPGYDGCEALSAAHEHCPGVPFIVVSGFAHRNIAPQSGEQPAAAVAKSELAQLAPAIRGILRINANPEKVLADSTWVAIESADRLSDLEQRLIERTRELHRRCAQIEVLNKELEAFSYSVAHDLRAPLITIDGFTQVLLESSVDQLDATSRGHLERICGGARRMHRLINDLLELSKVARAPMHHTSADLTRMAQDIVRSLQQSVPERATAIVIAEGLATEGDADLLRIALENLFSNAWKFTSKSATPRIEFGARTGRSGRKAYYVRDNGAGFDPRHAANLFSPFRRLHTEAQFPGTGIGLATVQRIVHRHGGEIWAEAAVDRGACFHFTLPTEELSA
jgi:signal transduction histidine kinase